MNKVVEYVIAAKDRTAAAVSSAVSRLSSFAKSAAANLANVKAGLDMALGAVKTFARVFAAAIGEAFRFEKAIADFKVLLGSVDAAKDHIAQLRAFAAATPLTFGDLSKASKLILSFGASVESVMPSLKMLGDISMGDAQKFQGLALVFSQVQAAGRLMGQDLLQMINQGFNPLTVIAKETGKSVAELKDMMSEGAISFEMVAAAMRSATEEGGLFHNALKETSTTGQGLVSTLQDKWTDAVRTFGEAFTGTAKGGLQTLIDKLDELVESGAVERFAETLSRGLAGAVEKIEETVEAVGALKKVLWDHSGVGDAWHKFVGSAKGVGSFAGTLAGGGSFKDAAKAYFESEAEEVAKGFYGREKVAAGWYGERLKRLAEDPGAGGSPGLSRSRRPKREASASAASQAAAGGGKSVADLMAEVDAKRAEEAASKAEEAAAKLAAKKAEEERRLRAEEERERKAIERRVHAERVRLLAEELSARQSAESEAAQALAAAQAKTEQAWGWYRDKDSLRAQLDEERANAAAEAQFERDFERLRSKRRDWRTAADYDPGSFRSLSLDETAVKRVALAREEEQKAREYARKTAEATERAADALDDIREAIADDEGAYA